MINKRIIAITAVLAFSLNALTAQGRFEYGGDLAGGARNGTSSAVSLLIPQGAAYLSGGGAVATATGVGAAYWNPAGMSRAANNLETTFSQGSHFAVMSVMFAGAAVKQGKNSFGISVRSLDVGEIPVTTVFAPDGTGEKFSPSNFTAGLTVSRMMSAKTSMGVTINSTTEGFRRVKGNALTLDAGVQYSDFLNITGLDVGVAVRNFGRPMRYEGSGLLTKAVEVGTDRLTQFMSIEPAEFDVPMLFEMGAAYDVMPGLQVAGTYESNNFEQDKVKVMGSYSLPGLLTVRAGMLLEMETVERTDDSRTTTVDESSDKVKFDNLYDGVSFGGTVYLQRYLGVNASIDYAYIPTGYDGFDASSVFTLNVGF